MFCKYCGNELKEDSKFCANCGAEVTQQTTSDDVNQQSNLTHQNNVTEPTQTKYSGSSIAGFVLSLVGLLIAGIPCGILGIIFSSISFKEIKTNNLKGKGLAIAGLVISIIDVVFTVIYLSL